MGCRGHIRVGEYYTRIYGMGDRPDPPYVMKLSENCCSESFDLRKALIRTGTHDVGRSA